MKLMQIVYLLEWFE